MNSDTLKGGAGSGNFGHAGRPGRIGGSAPSGVSLRRDPVNTYQIVDTLDELRSLPSGRHTTRGYFILPNGRLLDVTSETGEEWEHADAITAILRKNPEVLEMGISREQNLSYSHIADKLIRVREWDFGVNFTTERVDTRTLHRLQKLYHENKLPVNYHYDWISMGRRYGEDVWTNLSMSVEEFLAAKRVVYRDGVYSLKEFEDETTKGGQGSGNFGHAGRPGKVGGSAAGSVHAGIEAPGQYAPGSADWSEDNKNGSQIFNVWLEKRNVYQDPEVNRGLIKRTICAKIAEDAGVEPVFVSEILHHWAVASDCYMSCLFKNAICEELGVSLSPYEKKREKARRDLDARLKNVAGEVATEMDKWQKDANEGRQVIADEISRVTGIQITPKDIELSIETGGEVGWNAVMETVDRIGGRAPGGFTAQQREQVVGMILKTFNNDTRMAAAFQSRENIEEYLWHSRTEDAVSEAGFDTVGLDIHTVLPEIARKGLAPDIHQKLRKVARAMYDRTQGFFAENGITSLTLFRGTKRRSHLPARHRRVYAYAGNSVESWSTVEWTASEFGNTLYRMSIPAASVFCTSATGLGCSGEHEVVIFGSTPGAECVETNLRTKEIQTYNRK